MRCMYSFFCFVALLFLVRSHIAAETTKECTIDDQIAVEVTVYNNNLALVKDTRRVDLPQGEGELRFMDVASHIQPETVRAKSLNHQELFSVLEQNYEYDLMNAEKLLDKYVGKDIKILLVNEYQDRKEIVNATLLSNNNGQIYKIKDEIFLGHPGIKILPKIPENLIAKPTLTWLYTNKSKKTHRLEVLYLTNNISWKADYIVILNEGDTLSDVSGWVTLDNQSGTTYKEANLKLIAGDVHRVREIFMDRAMPMREMRAAKAPQFEQKEFFEYHIYDLQRKTTIKNKQTKQVGFLEADTVKVQKELLVHGMQSYFTRHYRDDVQKQKVNVYIKMKNAEANNLGMPMPAGIMRLYKQDDAGSLQFIGEDRIDHTPKNEEIELKIGEAFDVVAERKQTDYRQITSRLHETEWEITVRNHKKEVIKVGIIELLSGNWSVINNSHPYKKTGAFTIRFDVDIPADEEVTIKYRVKVGL